MRCLMLAADDLLRPDEGMTDELKGMSAALNRVGNNVNQVARRLNEAKLKGERLPYTPASHAEMERTMYHYITYHLERRLKSVDFMHRLQRQMGEQS